MLPFPPTSEPAAGPAVRGGSLVTVTAASSGEADAAKRLAARYGLPHGGVTRDGGEDRSLQLVLTTERLELRMGGTRSSASVSVEFTTGATGYRLRQATVRSELVARAVGLTKGRRPSVLDAMAGLGRDGVLLAWLGCPVHMVERSPVVAALLEDGLRRLAADAAAPVGLNDRLTFTHGDAVQVMAAAPQRWHVVYLDPMFPAADGGAKVKKAMQALHRVVGAGEGEEPILAAAMAHATDRVVVKRPPRGPALEGREPDITYAGRTARFDVYLAPVDALPSEGSS